MKIWKGAPYPLGATWMGTGTNFALFAPKAEKVELCLYDGPHDPKETDRVTLQEMTDEVWHVFLPDVRPTQLYGYRVYGPWEPQNALRFNPAKVLIDPYARALTGNVHWAPEMFGYVLGNPEADLVRDDRDNAAFVPKAVVVDQTFHWDNDRAPRHALEDTILYETHVRGFSELWEELDPELRGTYSGLGSPQAIAYFKKLGITAVELLPVHVHIDDQHLLERGLSNYWGYNSICFFAPEATYASRGERGEQVAEFKQMVKNLHSAGIEVILDVVYNHTAEGNEKGPMFSFRGIDNPAYYRLVQDNPRYYFDYTGTGNTLNVPQPRVLQMIMDSLRYWVQEMHVDGFRFDLAAALARELHEVSRLSAFFDVIHQDPVISQVKLIAEPWDVGEGGYQVGNFPVLWCEWNGRYRDTVRRYWRGDEGQTNDFAYRLTGSSDLYQNTSKNPTASINFITAHDGFTLRDLVSYNEKHNEANGEGNADGESNNLSFNCGAEGETDDKEVLKLRARQQRNFLTTLFLSQGIPMLSGGDEWGRTQRGNNNASCQDNEISWHSWKLNGAQQNLFDFTCKLIALRRDHPIFHRPRFFKGRTIKGDVKDISWVKPDGHEMETSDWDNAGVRALGVLLCGDDMGVTTFEGYPIKDDTYYLCFNAFWENVDFTLPGRPEVQWQIMIDTALEEGFVTTDEWTPAGTVFPMPGRSIRLYRQLAGGDEQAKGTLAAVPHAKKVSRKRKG
ncbi:MAG TPA: glycogen debranching protein GlgX [Candidatus Methylacidiphilales bacterium]